MLFTRLQKNEDETRIIGITERMVKRMSKRADFKNRDRFIQLGIAISTLRRMRGMSQEQLAEKANVSRSFISAIEAPGLARPFSLVVFFNIADALDVDPADLINASVFPERILKNKK